MNESCEEIGPLLTGYLDDELDSAERERVDRHLRDCERCRAAFDAEHSIIQAADELEVPAVDDDAWDEFLANVYNRLERRLGWTLLILGAAAVGALGLYMGVVVPWASPTLKVVFAMPFAGLGLLFVSVLRQRLHIAKTDRYSRDIKR